MNSTELKRTRLELNLTVPEFAEALGVPVSTYYERESGKAKIKRESAKLVRFVAKEIKQRQKLG